MIDGVNFEVKVSGIITIDVHIDDIMFEKLSPSAQRLIVEYSIKQMEAQLE